MNGLFGPARIDVAPYVGVALEARPFGADIDMTKFLGCQGSGGMQKNTNPLPVGRYWIDLIGLPNIQDFMGALNAAAAGGVVVIENTETYSPSAIEKLTGGLTQPEAWVLFRVTGYGSISIDATRYGYPTIAPTCVQTRDDTDTSDTSKALDDQKQKQGEMLLIGGVALVAILLLAHSVNEVAGAVHAVEGK